MPMNAIRAARIAMKHNDMIEAGADDETIAALMQPWFEELVGTAEDREVRYVAAELLTPSKHAQKLIEMLNGKDH